MVQAVNTKAILTLAAVIRRPSLLVPHVSVDNISQLDYAALKRYAGIQAIIFDKDNTLTAPYAQGVTAHPLAQLGLQHAIDVFGKDRVAILSNSAGTMADDGPDFTQALAIEVAMGISVIRHEEKKPGGLQDVLKHFDLQQQTNTSSASSASASASCLCMVGDRLLTDVVFGNLHGMLTVHTLPLLRGRENRQVDNWTASLIRPVENALLYNSCSLFGGRRRFRLLPNQPPAHAHWPGPGVHSLKLLPPKGPTIEEKK
jgi:phosphatidylglycerophosphatase GEP4